MVAALYEWGSYTTFGWGIDLFYLAFDTSVSHLSDENWHAMDPGDLDWRVTTLTVRVPLGGEAEGSFWTELVERLGW